MENNTLLYESNFSQSNLSIQTNSNDESNSLAQSKQFISPFKNVENQAPKIEIIRQNQTQRTIDLNQGGGYYMKEKEDYFKLLRNSAKKQLTSSNTNSQIKNIFTPNKSLLFEENTMKIPQNNLEGLRKSEQILNNLSLTIANFKENMNLSFKNLTNTLAQFKQVQKDSQYVIQESQYIQKMADNTVHKYQIQSDIDIKNFNQNSSKNQQYNLQILEKEGQSEEEIQKYQEQNQCKDTIENDQIYHTAQKIQNKTILLKYLKPSTKRIIQNKIRSCSKSCSKLKAQVMKQDEREKLFQKYFSNNEEFLTKKNNLPINQTQQLYKNDIKWEESQDEDMSVQSDCEEQNERQDEEYSEDFLDENSCNNSDIFRQKKSLKEQNDQNHFQFQIPQNKKKNQQEDNQKSSRMEKKIKKNKEWRNKTPEYLNLKYIYRTFCMA